MIDNELGRFDKWLIDPPRDGAMELVKSIRRGRCPAPHRLRFLQPGHAGARCRRTGAAKGYVLKAAGVMNMFPHTSHVESIALFVKEPE